MARAPKFTKVSWGQLVREADPDFDFESRHPKVYLWSGGRERRDPGAGGGPYANNAVEQQTYVTADGTAGFVSDPGTETFISEVKG